MNFKMKPEGMFWNYVLCPELFCIILQLPPPSVFLYRRICLHHSPLSPHKSMASSISETCWAVPFSLPGTLALKRPYDFLGHNFQVPRKYFILKGSSFLVVVVQLLSHIRLFVAPWTAACQTSLSFTICWSLPKFMSNESVIPSNHLFHCCPLFHLPSIFPSIRIFSNGSTCHIRWLTLSEIIILMTLSPCFI